MNHEAINLDPPNSQFVAAMRSISKGRCSTDTVQFLKGGVSAEIRHVEPSIEQVAGLIAPALEDGISETDRLLRIVRRTVGFFISPILIAKARNLLAHRETLLAKVSDFKPLP